MDTLIGFLTLPVGRIIKFLEGASMIHRPECKVAPRPSTTVTFPPGCPYSPAPRKGKTDSGEHFAMSSISNILQSVAKLDDKEMMVEKNCLVDPKPATPFGAGKLLDSQSFISSDESTQGSEVANYYGCGNVCCFLTSNSATKCPKHKKKMNIPFKIVERNVASQSDAIEGSDEIPQEQPDTESVHVGTRLQRARQCASQSCGSPRLAPSTKLQRSPSRAQNRLSLTEKPVVSAFDSVRVTRGSRDMQLAFSTAPRARSINFRGGYVREGTKYMVTNTLEICPSSEAIKALITLQIIRSERVGDLDTMPVKVVIAEILELLKFSFTSTNVLNDVFGKYCTDPKIVVHEEKKDAFFPQCIDKPCCQCSRMGTPMLANRPF